ncbi:hypothetical protein [Arthrobacter glacialis]|uniref:Uncharacterized protein n=1 Tax=Arthrobacter glacialis TaxID=1664 RepID=A0A2S3ZTG8_ARTGL|nr:hypothetical protein [Arthrobacter glacialis]POH72556.1 hypothetical protein CVS27_15675 [Arthrobacter glacialis]
MSSINDTLEAIISIFPTVQALLTGPPITSNPVLTGITANVITSAIGKIINDVKHSRRTSRKRKGDGPRHRK